jgi:hypothetical protein
MTWDSRKQAYYSEAGAMHRHYSTCRTAVLTAVFPICLALLGGALSSRLSLIVRIYAVAAEVLLFAFAASLSLFFSKKTEQTRRILVGIESDAELPGTHLGLGSGMRGHHWYGWLDNLGRAILLVGAVLHVGFWIYFIASLESAPIAADANG